LTHGGKEVGFAGEVHPRVLGAFGLEMPVAAVELELGPLGLWS
jgi:phenylalanyl-tRNA synthetase beta subunit